MDAKRIREIAAQTVTQILRGSSTDDGFDFDTARSFAWHAITQAVNEALEEAAKACDKFAVGPMERAQWLTANECAEIVRALKVKE